MKILNYTQSSTSFKRKVKIDPSKVNLSKITLGITGTAVGTTLSAFAADSMLQLFDKTPTILPQNELRHSLFSVAAEEGIPAQSTLAPTTMSSLGISSVEKGAKILDDSIPD